jgi:L-Ala-D/L-Glu epimerase
MQLRLKETFTIARETWDAADNVFVVLGFGDVTGAGEVSPDARWGESVASVRAALEAVDLDRLAGPFDLEGVTDLLPAGSARCALDIALHDVAAQIAGVSLAELAGVGGRPLPPTSVTLPIQSRDEMVARARALADHPVLKMKVGFDGDVEAVAAVRKVYAGALRVDANEGWNESDAMSRLPELETFDIELCEQPIPAGDPQALKRVAEATSIPIFADEDVATSEDVVALAGVVDGVNLKLRKAGGMRATIKAVATARACRLGVMLGCDLESGVAATAQASLSALVDFADLDGPLLLESDPFPGVGYERGVMSLPSGPGLGLQRSPG